MTDKDTSEHYWAHRKTELCTYRRKGFLLAEEIDDIRSRAAEHDSRLVTVGPLVLSSTATGDAWLFDPADFLAARISREGDPEDLFFEESDTDFAIGWKGNYQIEGDAFVFYRPRHRTCHNCSRLSHPQAR
jgi:hypothetical protein